MKRPHPLSLVLLALWFSTAAIFVPQLPWLAAVLILSILFSGFHSGFEPRAWLRQLVKFLPVFLAIIIIQILFVKEGKLLWGASWFAVYSGGLGGGISFCLRLLILFFSASFLLKLDFEDFEAAFTAVRLPEELGFMVFYGIHVIPSASRQIGDSRIQLRLRGIDLKKLHFKEKIRIYGRISLCVLADVLSRSSLQAISLELRGFRSPGQRSHLHQRCFGAADLAMWAALVLLTALYLVNIYW
ncbi:MAG: energy-coupling factor transporter transmembrane component T family protein [Candidatus Syntrophosphaera sp.]